MEYNKWYDVMKDYVIDYIFYCEVLSKYMLGISKINILF